MENARWHVGQVWSKELIESAPLSRASRKGGPGRTLDFRVGELKWDEKGQQTSEGKSEVGGVAYHV